MSGGGRRRRRRGGGWRWCVPETRTATGARGIALRHLVAAVVQLLLAQPLVVGGPVSPPAQQEASDSAPPAAVELQLHLVLALLSRVGDPTRSKNKEGFEAIDEDGRAAVHGTRQHEGVGMGARAGEHRDGTVPPREQLTNVGGVEQLIGPQQHAVADLEHRVDPARIEPRFSGRPAPPRAHASSPPSSAHPLRVVHRRLAGGEVVVRWRELETGLCAARR